MRDSASFTKLALGFTVLSEGFLVVLSLARRLDFILTYELPKVVFTLN